MSMRQGERDATAVMGAGLLAAALALTVLLPGRAAAQAPPVTVEVTEAIAVADAPTTDLSAFIHLLETIGVGDAPTTDLSAFIHLLETIGVTDAPGLQLSALVALIEAIGVTDAPGLQLSALVALIEAIGVTDAPGLQLSALVALIEAIGVTDAPGLQLSALVALIEAIGVADALVDQDFDGISNSVDVQDALFSDDFTDQPLSGTTFGVIADRDGLLVLIEDVPAAGVSVGAIGGAGEADLLVCDPPLHLFLTAGDSGVLTCGSLTLAVLTGPIVTLIEDGLSVSVPDGTTVAITESNGVLEIETTDGTEPATVTVDGVSVPLAPGDTLSLPGGCLGDVTADGVINAMDLRQVARAVPSEPGDRKWDAEADLNGDGRVDEEDLEIVRRFFLNPDCPRERGSAPPGGPPPAAPQQARLAYLDSRGLLREPTIRRRRLGSRSVSFEQSPS